MTLPGRAGRAADAAANGSFGVRAIATEVREARESDGDLMTETVPIAATRYTKSCSGASAPRCAAAQLYAPGHPLVARNVVVVHRRRPAPARGRCRRVVDRARRRRGGRRRRADDARRGDPRRPLRQAQVARRRARLDRQGRDRRRTGRHRRRARAAGSSRPATRTTTAFPDFPHVRVGLVRVEQRTQTTLADMATIRKLYSQASSTDADRLGERGARGRGEGDRGAGRRGRTGAGRQPEPQRARGAHRRCAASTTTRSRTW